MTEVRAVAMVDANAEKVAASVARAVANAAHPIRRAQKLKIASALQKLLATKSRPKTAKTLRWRAQPQNAVNVAHATVMAAIAVNVKQSNAQNRTLARLHLLPMM
jgi:uncharacterized iron-regulated protein